MSERGTAVARLRDELLAELFDGTYRAGVKLPNEDELADRWGVSRATVREAVGSLVEAGYLTRRHGSGTFVVGTLPRRHALDMSVSYTSMIREAGMEPAMTIIDQEEREASAEEAEALRVRAGEPLLWVERIRTADGRPVVYSFDRLPKRFAPDGVGFGGSLYQVLEGSGHAVQGASARLVPVVAGERLAELLEVEMGTPLLHIDQIDLDADGQPVMLSAEWHVADAFELHINRRAAH
ncbi:MAG TPA: GntR family transcriptional regulator [Solirubrobacterales bacterium]|nr:GntR family transcriptional regulator [Solirubrobacterales bacterium]